MVTEKIDGTNACIMFGEKPDYEVESWRLNKYNFWIGAQSRNRLLLPGRISGDSSSDNFGFAEWVYTNADELFELLGPGRHYGEWWGQAIGRNYGMDTRRFSLFNTDKWGKVKGDDVPFDYVKPIGNATIGSVPVLYHGPFSQRAIQECLYDLDTLGSMAAPGFKNPEGICVFHSQSKKVYKVTLDNQDKGKWEAGE